MTLTPSDILEIQSAIDGYEKRFPRKPSPSVAEALAWRLGTREPGNRAASQSNSDPGSRALDAEPSPQECNRMLGKRETIRLRVRYNQKHSTGLPFWVKRPLQFCGWGLVAVLTALCFLFGASLGGFKWVP
jgi:hypothetical protein